MAAAQIVKPHTADLDCSRNVLSVDTTSSLIIAQSVTGLLCHKMHSAWLVLSVVRLVFALPEPKTRDGGDALKKPCFARLNKTGILFLLV